MRAFRKTEQETGSTRTGSDCWGNASYFSNIKTRKKDRRIDDEVVAVAHDKTFWDKKAHVKPKSKPTSIRFRTRAIERAKFFAEIHGERGFRDWIKKIVEGRVSTEYELYKRLKREVV